MATKPLQSITFPGLPDTYTVPSTPEEIGAASLEYARQIGNPRNLLDNSDFTNPVNQRGKTVYQQDSGYSIDRWKMKWSGEGELKVNDGYITLYRPVHATYVFQNIPLEKHIIGKTVTLAAKVRGYGFLSYNFNGAYKDELFSLTDWEVIAYSFTVPDYNYESSDIYGVGLITQSDKHLDCEWIALYEGEYTIENLPEYQPKGYAAELAECQRYYLKLSHDPLGTGYTTGGGGAALIIVPIPVTMRTTPSIEYTTSDFYVRVNGTDYAAPNGPSIGEVRGNNFIHLSFANIGVPAKYPAACYKLTGKVALSADL